MRKRIVFADEARHEVRPLLMELDFQGVEVDFYSNADECVLNVARSETANLYVLDIMLLTKGLFPDTITDQQLYTGLILGCVIRELHPNAPIVFYSALSSDIGLRYTRNTIERIGNSILIRKHYVSSPLEFWEQIDPIITSGKVPKAGSSIFSALTKGLVAQPNVAGIGFDVKEFIKELRERH